MLLSTETMSRALRTETLCRFLRTATKCRLLKTAATRRPLRRVTVYCFQTIQKGLSLGGMAGGSVLSGG